jgi:hypothetical protein
VTISLSQRMPAARRIGRGSGSGGSGGIRPTVAGVAAALARAAAPAATRQLLTTVVDVLAERQPLLR